MPKSCPQSSINAYFFHKVKLSVTGQFLPKLHLPVFVYQRLRDGRVCANKCLDEVARNGAFLRINFGQRFS